ncbi:hypothetical protein MtrunA17_Chr4g0045761 [Medicago truncatula]|uniref:Transmembrane protein n=1 Tax=Medicago truncatula TaxID=3880 RepID=A0A396IDF6_MEDTR|nr:hypothetical protein MtrunA17_Chr4g0045761 [Medicago truncatula]
MSVSFPWISITWHSCFVSWSSTFFCCIFVFRCIFFFPWVGCLLGIVFLATSTSIKILRLSS